LRDLLGDEGVKKPWPDLDALRKREAAKPATNAPPAAIQGCRAVNVSRSPIKRSPSACWR
jgi:hypothetical protein